jgi:hypothetical protein
VKLKGRYVVGGPISSGAFGRVYAGSEGDTGRPLAIKHMVDVSFARRFTIEARLLEQLDHPRVVRVFDHFSDDSGMYVVMERVDGIDLWRLLRKRGQPGLPVEEAVRYASEACEALEYVHRQQIVHRDVKPANLMLGSQGVVLVDFGIARQLDTELQGTIGIGTPRFMAPEVLIGGYSPRSDVFGIAATLWTLLAGSAPMYGSSENLRLNVANVGETLEAAVKGGLELSPERRIASAKAFARAIGAPVTKPVGTPLALSVEGPSHTRNILEAIVRTAAGVFDAASASLALKDPATGEVVYKAAWGAGARDVVGVRLSPGTGIAGAAVESGQEQVVPDCSEDVRFARDIAAVTGYLPTTMLVVPLMKDGESIGALSLLDRRDGGSYGASDLGRAELFSDLAVSALDPEAGGGPPEDGDRLPTLTSPT